MVEHNFIDVDKSVFKVELDCKAFWHVMPTSVSGQKGYLN